MQDWKIRLFKHQIENNGWLPVLWGDVTSKAQCKRFQDQETSVLKVRGCPKAYSSKLGQRQFSYFSLQHWNWWKETTWMAQIFTYKCRTRLWVKLGVLSKAGFQVLGFAGSQLILSFSCTVTILLKTVFHIFISYQPNLWTQVVWYVCWRHSIWNVYLRILPSNL